jgi:hypothetical protein
MKYLKLFTTLSSLVLAGAAILAAKPTRKFICLHVILVLALDVEGEYQFPVA